MSSPNTHAFPCKIASVAKGEVIDFGGDGVNSEDNDGGDDGGWKDEEDDVVEVLLSVRLSSEPNYKYSSGFAILPSIAEAAAVAGDER